MASMLLIVAAYFLFVVAARPAEILRGLPSIPQRRIVGGVETNISDVPYQLALEWNGHQFCAASILSPTFAISASHCLYQFIPEEVVVRTGSTIRETDGEVIGVKNFYYSSKYKRAKIDYDVAIIELESPIKFGLNSQPIALTDKEPQPGQTVLVSGWGSLQEKGDAPVHLHSLEISIINRALCKTSYQNIEKITERMFCAGAPGFDSCKGDSGGPIVQNRVLVGIVSWGKGCGRVGYPGVYTNIANVEIREFIRNITGV